MPVLRFCALFLTLMLLATTLFGMLPVDAAPPRKTKKPALTKPIIRLGQPYRAELRRKDIHRHKKAGRMIIFFGDSSTE